MDVNGELKILKMELIFKFIFALRFSHLPKKLTIFSFTDAMRRENMVFQRISLRWVELLVKTWRVLSHQ